MATGKIGVTTENIFPVIKKFLYSDHEIFLRELVSNAVDATQKIRTLSSFGEFKGELGTLDVRVVVDKDKGTLTVIDRGIGMDKEDVDKYINQIAFSGAEEFLQKYKDTANNIIGHFGLGFYSAFMVSKKVEIRSLSYKEGAKGVLWTCDGSPEYTMEECDKSDRGTEITLYIDDESKEFLDIIVVGSTLNHSSLVGASCILQKLHRLNLLFPNIRCAFCKIKLLIEHDKTIVHVGHTADNLRTSGLLIRLAHLIAHLSTTLSIKDLSEYIYLPLHGERKIVAP